MRTGSANDNVLVRAVYTKCALFPQIFHDLADDNPHAPAEDNPHDLAEDKLRALAEDNPHDLAEDNPRNRARSSLHVSVEDKSHDCVHYAHHIPEASSLAGYRVHGLVGSCTAHVQCYRRICSRCLVALQFHCDDRRSPGAHIVRPTDHIQFVGNSQDERHSLCTSLSLIVCGQLIM